MKHILRFCALAALLLVPGMASATVAWPYTDHFTSCANFSAWQSTAFCNTAGYAQSPGETDGKVVKVNGAASTGFPVGGSITLNTVNNLFTRPLTLGYDKVCAQAYMMDDKAPYDHDMQIVIRERTNANGTLVGETYGPIVHSGAFNTYNYAHAGRQLVNVNDHVDIRLRWVGHPQDNTATFVADHFVAWLDTTAVPPDPNC